MLEEWHEWVPWFEGYYSVTRDWDIYSYWKRGNRWAILQDTPQVKMQPRENKDSLKSKSKPRPVVTLYNGLVKKKMFVSRIVAIVFLHYDVNSKLQIIHKDWDNYNNSVDNLKIWTVSERTLNWIRVKENAI